MAEKYKGPYDLKGMGLEIGPRRAGGGWKGRVADARPRASEMVDTPSKTASVDRAMGTIEQSIKDRGGYPTRNGQPKMTKMQLRQEQRRADYEATQGQGVEERARRRQERAAKSGITGYAKGGMIRGKQCREYGK